MPTVYRRRPPHWMTALALLSLLLIGRSCLRPDSDDPDGSQVRRLVEGEYRLHRVVDGDTIIIRPPDAPADARRLYARVRLVGVDAPEIFDHGPAGTILSQDPEPYGPDAAAYTADFLRKGKLRVRMGPRRVDRYGRFLAFVFVADRLLNAELVRAGLAKAKIYAGEESSLSQRIVRAQDEARAAGRGIWTLPEYAESSAAAIHD